MSALSAQRRRQDSFVNQAVASMDATLLIIGTEQFKTTLLEHVALEARYRVKWVRTLTKAQSWMQTTTPDIVCIQVSQVETVTAWHRLRSRQPSEWFYGVAVDERVVPAHLVSDLATKEWELQQAAIALEQGANAYVRLDAPEDQDCLATQIKMPIQLRVLQAELDQGVKLVKQLRSLAKTNDLLSTMVLSDQLTGLSNRRALDWDLPRQIRKTRDRSLPLSLMVLDADHFKTVNDTYGHLVGDAVLKLLSQRLQYNLRFNDTLFRYGGEEFVIILTNTALKEAVHVGERLRTLVSQQPFVVGEALTLPLSISVGVTVLTNDDDDHGSSLLDRADQNLLQAKAQGRDRVVSS